MSSNIEHKLIKLFKGKKIVFLENDNVLPDLAENLASFFKLNNIEYQCILEASKKGIFDLLFELDSYDIIVYHTTWITEFSHTLKQHYLQNTTKDLKKTFVELIVDEPIYYTKPKTIHYLYFINTYDEDMNNWEFSDLNIKEVTNEN